MELTESVEAARPLRLLFFSGLALLERRLQEALASLSNAITIHALGRRRASEIEWARVVEERELFVVGPDVAFDDALEAIRRAHAARETLPILMIREEHDALHVHAAARAGCRAFMLFPIEPDRIRAHVEKLLNASLLTGRLVAAFVSEGNTVLADMPLRRVAETIIPSRSSGATVVDQDGRAIGFLSVKDMLVAFRLRGPAAGDLVAAEVMKKPIVHVTPETPLDVAIDLFVQKGIRTLPVVKDGRPAGILLRRDALRALLEA